MQYVSRREHSVIKFSICQYAMSGYMYTKPGGTAGVLLLSLQVMFVGDEGIFLWKNLLCSTEWKPLYEGEMAKARQMKGENQNE